MNTTSENQRQTVITPKAGANRRPLSFSTEDGLGQQLRPYRRLWGAVLLCAVRDAQGRGQLRGEARRFLASAQGQALAKFCDIPRPVRRLAALLAETE